MTGDTNTLNLRNFIGDDQFTIITAKFIGIMNSTTVDPLFGRTTDYGFNSTEIDGFFSTMSIQPKADVFSKPYDRVFAFYLSSNANQTSSL